MRKEKNLLTCPTAAFLVGLSPHAIREAVRRGDIAAVRPSQDGRPLIQVEELARWAKSIGLRAPSPRTNMNPTKRLAEHDAEAWASGRQKLARDLMDSLEGRPDCVQPHVLRKIRQVLEHLLV